MDIDATVRVKNIMQTVGRKEGIEEGKREGRGGGGGGEVLTGDLFLDCFDCPLGRAAIAFNDLWRTLNT